MADTRVDVLQINLHHSKSATVVLTRCMTVRNTGPAIALVQEPWLVRNAIKGLSRVPTVTGHIRSYSGVGTSRRNVGKPFLLSGNAEKRWVQSGSTANALDLLRHYCAEVNICLDSLVEQNTAEHGL